MLKNLWLLVTAALRQSLLIGLLLAAVNAGLIKADPSDDFTFSLHSAEGDSAHLMSERRISEILADRLDLFPRSQTSKLAKHLLGLCAEYRFDPAFILSVIQVESRFRTKAVSPAGAIGLMQLMPKTAQLIARRIEAPYAEAFNDLSRVEAGLRDPFVNLELGVAYLATLRDRYRDLSPYYLVAAYNVGPGKMDELLSRKTFKPVNTKRYYESIRRQVPEMRFYRRPASV